MPFNDGFIEFGNAVGGVLGELLDAGTAAEADEAVAIDLIYGRAHGTEFLAGTHARFNGVVLELLGDDFLIERIGVLGGVGFECLDAVVTAELEFAAGFGLDDGLVAEFFAGDDAGVEGVGIGGPGRCVIGMVLSVFVVFFRLLVVVLMRFMLREGCAAKGPQAQGGGDQAEMARGTMHERKLLLMSEVKSGKRQS